MRIPRKQFATAAKSRSELKHTGVYLLVGRADVAGERNRVYVGEAEELGKRILQPRTPEIEWTDALVFTRKSNELNKAHVKYLENILFDKLKSANRYDLMNGKTPTRSSLHETDEYAMEDFAERIELLTGVLGHPMFVSLLKPEQSEIETAATSISDDLLFRMGVPKSNLKAQMRRTDEGYVILAGSYARKETVTSASETLLSLRKRLIADGTLIEADG